jgi:homoserine O-acetyltransferase/O-succinyltransferase
MEVVKAMKNYQHFIDRQTKIYRIPEPVTLESGKVLMDVHVAYCTWGTLNKKGNNAILICHALTGWANAEQWWTPLFGPEKSFDPQKDFIICSNVLGSCYGTTGPTSINPETGEVYGPDFPLITIRDMVQIQGLLLEALGVEHLKLVIGGSLGGMQVLEWGVLYPEKVDAIASFAISGRHSGWCIGISEAQRQAIYADPNWCNGYYTAEKEPKAGLAAARMMAMLTYRSRDSFEVRFGRERQLGTGDFAIESYLRYHGDKLVKRFDANSYIRLTQAMDSHDLGRDRENYEEVLRGIKLPTLIVGISSDVLYPPVEQQELADLIPNAEIRWLKSPHGHDAFLIDMEILNEMILEFGANKTVNTLCRA